MPTMSDSAPAAPQDLVVALYMRDIDRALLRRNLTLTPQQRLDQLQSLVRFADELRRAGEDGRGPDAANRMNPKLAPL